MDEFEQEQTRAAPLSDQDMIAALEARGFIVSADLPTQRQIDLGGGATGRVKFGVVSDTHLGHHNQQITHLRDFYEKAAEWGVEFMLHGGDLVDGQNMHRDQQFELFKHGVEAQAGYAAEVLPVARNKRGKVLPTYGIGGNHDGSGWNDVGANVLGRLADKRDDYQFLGAPTATFHYGPLRIMLMHPDGGVAYARSYKLQKIVEGFEADAKPHLLVCGHWHVYCHVHVRNVHAFACPAFQAQTAYIKRKGLFPVVGGLLFDVEYNELGPTSVTHKLVTYANTIPKDWP